MAMQLPMTCQYSSVDATVIVYIHIIVGVNTIALYEYPVILSSKKCLCQYCSTQNLRVWHESQARDDNTVMYIVC